MSNEIREAFAKLYPQFDALIKMYEEKSPAVTFLDLLPARNALQDFEKGYLAAQNNSVAAQVPEEITDLVSEALRRTWHLGQTYWQQADSDYGSDNKKSEVTYQTFVALVEGTRAALLSTTQPKETAAPADPMDWPLPCDVTVGHGTMRKGVPLRTLLLRMKSLYEMATGNNADEVAGRSIEGRRARLDAFVKAVNPTSVFDQQHWPTLESEQHRLLDVVKEQSDETTKLREHVKLLRERLNELRQQHKECEDSWYSCPKSEGGCMNDSAGEECTCGADDTNAIIDSSLAATASHKG